MKINPQDRAMGSGVLVHIAWTLLIFQVLPHVTVFGGTTEHTTQPGNTTLVNATDAVTLVSSSTLASHFTTVAPSTSEPVQSPGNLTVTAVANDTLRVTWYGSSSCGYEMQWFSKGSLEGERSVPAKDAGIYHQKVTVLKAGAYYNITVRANSTTGLGEVISQADVTWPNVPDNVEVVSFTSGTISLKWGTPRGHIDAYNITYCCNNTCLSNTTHHTIVTLSGLQDGCLYNISLHSQSHQVSSDVSTFLQPTRPRPVQVIHTSVISPTSVAIQWTEDPQVNYGISYVLTVLEASCTNGPKCNGTVNITGHGRRRTITDLVPGRSYRLTVVSLRHNVSSQPFGTGHQTQPLRASNVTIWGEPEESFATVIISPPLNSEFDGFNITWTSVNTNAAQWVVHQTNLQKDIALNVTGLAAGHLYRLGVRTLNGNETSGIARLSPGGQFIARPSLPESVSVSVVNDTALRVEWTSVSGRCTNVNIAYSAHRDSVRHDQTEPCDGFTTILAGLTSNAHYNITLTTQSSQSNLTAVSDVYALSAWTLSAGVTQLDLRPESPTSLRLSWRFPASNAREQLRLYVIEVLHPVTLGCLQGIVLSNTELSQVTYNHTAHCDHGWKSGTFPGFNDVGYTVDSLDACATYSVRVSAINQAGHRGVASQTPVSMPAAEPSRNVFITNTSSATNTVYIEWSELELDHSQCPVIAYEINYTYVNCSTDLLEIETYNTTGQAETITHLQPYWTYTLTVSAYTHAGRGTSVSDIVNVTTLQTAPGPPRLPNVTSRSHDTINMTWLPPNRCEINGILTQYNVFYSFVDPSQRMVVTKNISVPGGQSTVTLTDAIRPYTVYNLTILGVTIGQGDPSITASTQTAQWYPGVINSSSVVVETTSDSVNLTWAEPLTPNGVIVNYTVRYKCHHRVIEMSCPHLNVEVTTSDTTRTLLVTGLRPYKKYEFWVKAWTDVGAGNYSQPTLALTDIGVPMRPDNVVVQPDKPGYMYIQWNGPEYCSGPTNYTVLVVDTRDPDKTFSNFTKGCYDQQLEMFGLDAYWPYKVTIMAETKAGYNMSETYYITTMQADPRKVQDLDARAEGGMCAEPALRVEWKTLQGRDRRGVIHNYTLHFRTTLGETFTKSFKESANLTQYEYVRVSPERQYAIQIWAYSQLQKGEVASLPHVNSGTCPPSLPETERLAGPSRLIYFTEQIGLDSKKTQYKVMVNRSFFDDTSNGALHERGVIVMNADNVDSSAERFDSLSLFNSKYKSIWATVKESSVVMSYRVILDHGGNGRYRRSTVVPSGRHEIVLGHDGNCDTDRSVKCNGYLRANSKYKVRVYTCTVSGCTVTAPSSMFQTAAHSQAGTIAAATLVPIFILILIMVILVFIMRKQQLGPFRKKKTRPEGTGDSGKLNEAFVELEEVVPKKPGTISQKDFGEHVKMMHKDSELLFSEEYKLLKMLSPRNPTTATELTQNRTKNRYTNILPFDHSRVKLLPIEDDESSDYINANYMPGYNSRREFIAAQGPLPSTKDDFWRMIWEQNVPMVVMLTRLVEKGREKCSQYWPQDNEAVYYGDLQVSMRSESVLDNYIIRIFDIQLGIHQRMIKQMHFIRWPDFGCPENTNALLDFVRDVRVHLPRGNKCHGPILVNCSAGVGRTGTFICVDHLLQHILDYDGINIFGMVLEMRQYRCHMVQTEDQYIYIHDCLRDALERQQLEDEGDEGDGPLYASRC